MFVFILNGSDAWMFSKKEIAFEVEYFMKLT